MKLHESLILMRPILVDGLPPLMCGGVRWPHRLNLRGDMPASEKWLVACLWSNLDWNGMDDRLQRVIAGFDQSRQLQSSLKMERKQSPS